MELLVVLGVVALLLAMVMPSLSAAKEQSRRTACAAQLKSLGTALRTYGTEHQEQMPPFAFSDQQGNLPLSGHWGGVSQNSDPACMPNRHVQDINLWRLVRWGYAGQAQLICPAAKTELKGRTSSYFSYTTKFSTYCLRMPYSYDLFRESPGLANFGNNGLLFAYRNDAGGEVFPWVTSRPVIPLARMDMEYSEVDPVSGVQRTMRPWENAILADNFWYQDFSQPANSPMPQVQGYPVQASWLHGDRFNVLFGGGVLSIQDNGGTVAANTVKGSVPPANDNANYASYAIRVWRFFEDRRAGK